MPEASGLADSRRHLNLGESRQALILTARRGAEDPGEPNLTGAPEDLPKVTEVLTIGTFGVVVLQARRISVSFKPVKAYWAGIFG